MPNKPEPWLDLCNVEAWLGHRPVLKDLSLELLPRQSATVLGPNGAGKSSLVKLIDRSLYPIVRPDSHCKLFGSSTVNLWHLRQRLGVVSSELEQRLDRRITCHELVVSSFFGSMRLGRDQVPSSTQRDQTDAVLAQLRLEYVAQRPYGELSDGQRRRLLIARALVHHPEVLLLDEPSRALDLKAAHQLMALLRELITAGTTVVQVTHRVDTIVPEMQRILFLNDGRITGDGCPREMLTSARLSELFDTPLRVVEAQGFHQVLPA